MCGPSVVRAILAPSTISPLFPSRGGGVSIDAIVVLPVVVVASSADFRARCTLVSLSSNLCIDSSTDVYSARRNTSVSTVPSSPFFDACEKVAANAVSSTSSLSSSFSSVFFRAALSFVVARTKLRAHAITSWTRIASTVVDIIFSRPTTRSKKEAPPPPEIKRRRRRRRSAGSSPMRSPFKSENPFPFSSASLDDEQKRLGDVLCAFQRGDKKRREKKSLLSFCLGFYFLIFFFL